jgi:multidrug/hemolysin transport system permease protein
MRKTVDCNISFFGNDVSIGAMYAVLGGTVVLLVAAYVLMNVMKNRAAAKVR